MRRRSAKSSVQQQEITIVSIRDAEHRDTTSNAHFDQRTRNVAESCRPGEQIAMSTVTSTDGGQPAAANIDESEHQYSNIQNEQQQCANTSTMQSPVGGVADTAPIVARTSLATPPRDNARDEAAYERLCDGNIEHFPYANIRPSPEISTVKPGDAEMTVSSNSETAPPAETATCETRNERLGEQNMKQSAYTNLRHSLKDDSTTKTNDAEETVLSDSRTAEQGEYERIGERHKTDTYTALSSAAETGKRQSPDFYNEILPSRDKDVSTEPDYQNERQLRSTEHAHRGVMSTNDPSSQPMFGNIAKFASPGNFIEAGCFLTESGDDDNHQDENKHAEQLKKINQNSGGSKTSLTLATLTDDAGKFGHEQTTENQYENLQQATEDDSTDFTRLRRETTMTTNHPADYTDAPSPSSVVHSV